MSVAETFDPTSLHLTERAVHKVQHLIEEEGNDDLKLRVFVTGGGCSGFQYGFTFDEERDGDSLVESGSLRMTPRLKRTVLWCWSIP